MPLRVLYRDPDNIMSEVDQDYERRWGEIKEDMEIMRIWPMQWDKCYSVSIIVFR